MDYRDYYATPGRQARCVPGRDQARLPQARPPAPSRRQARRPGRRGEVQGDQRGQRGPLGSPEALEVRQPRGQLGGPVEGRRRPAGQAPAGGRRAAIRSGRAARSPASAGRAGVARPLRVSDERRRRRLQRLLPDVLRRGRRGRPRPRRPAAAAARGPSAGPRFEDILAGLNLDGGGQAGPAGGAAASARGQVTSEADVEITLEEAFHGTSRLLELDGKRLEVAVPRGVETGSRIRLRGKGAGGGDLDLVTRVTPHPTFGRKGADLTRDAAADPARGAPRRRSAGRNAQGQGPPQDPGRHPERPDLPTDRPGHAPAQAQGGRQAHRRPAGHGPGGPADEPQRRGAAAAAGCLPRPRSTSPIRGPTTLELASSQPCNLTDLPRRPRRRSSPPSRRAQNAGQPDPRFGAHPGRPDRAR